MLLDSHEDAVTCEHVRETASHCGASHAEALGAQPGDSNYCSGHCGRIDHPGEGMHNCAYCGKDF